MTVTMKEEQKGIPAHGGKLVQRVLTGQDREFYLNIVKSLK